MLLEVSDLSTRGFVVFRKPQIVTRSAYLPTYVHCRYVICYNCNVYQH